LDRVYIETINGDITFTGTEGPNIKIETHIEIEGESEAIKEYAKEFKTVIARSDGRLMIKTVRPKDEEKFNDEIEHSSISYGISLPPEFDIKVETVNAVVVITAVYGDLLLQTVNGGITYEADKPTSGEIQAETVNGGMDIEVSALTEKCSFESVNGELSIRVTNSLKAELSAGTVNGSISLGVPESASFSFRAEVAINGDIKTDWGDGENTQFQPGETLEADVNGGGKKVYLETVNGSIEVRRTK
jgi:DUF4097 and DUF4098 domain-containing protein YvlB